MNIFKEIMSELAKDKAPLSNMLFKKTVVWNDGEFPYCTGVSNTGYGMSNMNNSKCSHKRRILRKMMKGERMTSCGYADKHNHTDFRKRVSELRNEFGMPIEDVWVKPDSGSKYKEYYLNINKLKEMM